MQEHPPEQPPDSSDPTTPHRSPNRISETHTPQDTPTRPSVEPTSTPHEGENQAPPQAAPPVNPNVSSPFRGRSVAEDTRGSQEDTSQGQHTSNRPGPLQEIFNHTEEHRVLHEVPQGPRSSHQTNQHRPRSRPKTKCGFGPRPRRLATTTPLAAHNAATTTPTPLEVCSPLITTYPPAQLEDATTTEGGLDIDALIREIDSLRQDNTLDPTQEREIEQAPEERVHNSSWAPPKSRLKAKCHFGPYSRKGHN